MPDLRATYIHPQLHFRSVAPNRNLTRQRMFDTVSEPPELQEKEVVVYLEALWKVGTGG